MINGQSLEEAIRTQSRALGFSACGFARADAADAAGLDIQRWIEAGHHGTMGWMEARAECHSAQEISGKGLKGEALAKIKSTNFMVGD